MRSPQPAKDRNLGDVVGLYLKIMNTREGLVEFTIIPLWSKEGSHLENGKQAKNNKWEMLIMTTNL